LAVDRAVAELRRGGVVIVQPSSGGAVLVQAAEAVTTESLARLAALAGVMPALALTGRRAAVLGLGGAGSAAVQVSRPGGFTAAEIKQMADPCAGDAAALPEGLATVVVASESGLGGTVALAKLARLLPAGVAAPLADDGQSLAERHDILCVAVDEILAYQHNAALTLRPVSEARVPLVGAENTRIVAFRPADGGIEHLAIIIGDPDPEQPVLARLHSECFTGDLLGSLRCDCGDQLRGAIAEIAQDGSGVLLYLAQEGRGIGLVNKLRAYQLQDQGFDTLDANEQLGFDDDERVYQPAAEMLRLLGIHRVRLMTNNPKKVAQLARHGIDVSERVPHIFPANDHNEGYLRTKATRSGHLF
jgi:GTP cyclohydrolase II